MFDEADQAIAPQGGGQLADRETCHGNSVTRLLEAVHLRRAPRFLPQAIFISRGTIQNPPAVGNCTLTFDFRLPATGSTHFSWHAYFAAPEGRHLRSGAS